jgi:RHS repeat-associated protein
VSHFPTTGNEDTSQRVTYIYDTNSLDTSHTFSNYTSGRLAAVQYGPVNTSTTNPNGTYLPTFAEWYNYQLSGLVATKRLQVLQPNYGITTPQAINFDGAYTYDAGGEGKILSVQYPSTSAGSGSKYTYSFDSMYRPVGMTDQNSNTDVSNVTYNPANQLLSINYFGSTESRTYNSLNQLTNVTGPGISKTYTYTAGANIGKISSQTDAISGETVQYVYDSLNRLYSATTTAGTAWSQTFTYDPFGNLTAKTGTGTAPPSIPVSAQPSALDANGNVTGTQGNAYAYDVENRMYEYYSTTGTGVAPAYYAYDTQNRRVWQWNGSTYASPYSTTPNSYTVYFYGVNGKRLAAYTLTAAVVWQGNKVQSLTMNSAVLTQDAYFGGRRLAGLDRVGSATQVGSQNVSFYPYGEDKGTPGANDNWKFGTYLRDSATGLDYAVNRYYSSGSGRFMSPDPYQASGGPAVPQSWNRYAYVQNDPINFGDPTGLYLTAEDCIADPDLCEEDDWGDSAGGGSDGDGQSEDPLQCFFTADKQFSGAWGVAVRNGRSVYGYNVMVYFTFVATGGIGPYTWTNTQDVTLSGTVSYSNGRLVNLSTISIPQESLAPLSNSPGGSITYHDAPGIGLYLFGRNGSPVLNKNGLPVLLVSGDPTWDLSLQVSVSDGTGASAQCPIVNWSVWELWTGSPASLSPTVTGGSIISTQPLKP